MRAEKKGKIFFFFFWENFIMEIPNISTHRFPSLHCKKLTNWICFSRLVQNSYCWQIILEFSILHKTFLNNNYNNNHKIIRPCSQQQQQIIADVGFFLMKIVHNEIVFTELYNEKQERFEEHFSYFSGKIYSFIVDGYPVYS